MATMLQPTMSKAFNHDEWREIVRGSYETGLQVCRFGRREKMKHPRAILAKNRLK